MVKFYKQKTETHDGYDNSYDAIDIIREDCDGFEWICECGKWDNEDAHFWADNIVNALLERFGEF